MPRGKFAAWQTGISVLTFMLKFAQGCYSMKVSGADEQTKNTGCFKSSDTPYRTGAPRGCILSAGALAIPAPSFIASVPKLNKTMLDASSVQKTMLRAVETQWSSKMHVRELVG